MRRPALMLSLAFLALACGEKKSSPSASGSAPPAQWSKGHPAREAGGFRYIPALTGGAKDGDKVPLVVALHANGDLPGRFVPMFAALKPKARLAYPFGPATTRGKPGWYDSGKRTQADYGAGAVDMVPRIAAFIEALQKEAPTQGRAILVGYSQGAVIAQTFAVKRPDLVSAVVSIHGFLPEGVAPAAWPEGQPRPDVFTFHGANDETLKPEWDRAGVDALRKLGLKVDHKETPGVGHLMSPDEAEAVADVVERAIDAAAGGR